MPAMQFTGVSNGNDENVFFCSGNLRIPVPVILNCKLKLFLSTMPALKSNNKDIS